MPHDRNGRRLAVGDIVKIKKDYLGRVPVGQIYKLNPAAESCNGCAMILGIGGLRTATFTCRESELIVQADGSEPPALDAIIV